MIPDFVKSKDPATQELLASYAGLIELIADEYVTSGMPRDEIVENAYIGLITAIDYYQLDRGPFPIYAARFMIGQIKNQMSDQGRVPRESAWIKDLAKPPEGYLDF